MKIIVTRLDVQRTRASWPDTVFTPAYVLSRDNGDKTKWLVADSPVPDDAAVGINWASAEGDEYVRIPLHEYNITPQGDLALAFAFKLGIIAARLAPFTVNKLHIVTGTPVELVHDEDYTVKAMNYWFGFAIAAEE